MTTKNMNKSNSVRSFLINNSNRLGIDLDDASEFKFLKTYYNAINMFPEADIQVYKSSGGQGYHIEIIGVKSTLTARRILGDCAGRMEFSEKRSKTKENADEFVIGNPAVDDILFAVKTRKFRLRSGREVICRQVRKPMDYKSILSLPFWSW